MTINEQYAFLFTDTFCGNFIFSLQDDFAFEAMQKFGFSGYNIWLVTLLAVLCSGIANYLFGYVLYNIFIKHAEQDTVARYYNIKSAWGKFHIIAFCLCFQPIAAKFVVLFCGVVKFRFLRSLLLLLAFKYLYYLNQAIPFSSYIPF